MAAVVDGTPTFNAGQSAGLYVWREANGTFVVRLTNGSKAQDVLGGFSSTKPLNWVALTALEANDVVTKANPALVNFELKTTATDYVDGVDFAVPAGAGVCFWSWGSLGKVAYLGAGKTPVTTPFDLLGNGACGTGNAAPAPTQSQTTTASNLKYHPGHYIAMNDWEGQSAMIEAASKPGVKGVLVRYLWKDLEPSYGVYDFSKVQSDLTLMRDHGMQLIARIEDKTFKPDVKPTPPYLWANYTVAHNNPSGGFVAKRWLPYVTERMAALTKAMGARFDGQPNFEGVTFEESCMGFTDAMQKSYGYTPEQYRDQIIQMLKNTRASFPTSQVFWSMNFLEGNQTYIGQIADAVVPYKVAMGGPDILPDNQSLVTLTYPYYRQFKGRMTLFGSIQYVEYGQLHSNKALGKYWTMPQLFVYARDQLATNYIFWTQKRTPDPADSYDWLDALPVIRNNPTFNAQ